ncbi:MAG: helix-turn-helix transcriptional regulator [Hyphomicrobium zavarzinii]|uniref:ArsR/SmtB family transcription factor n=1 Tax=Hyphomicrobium zavarzinii TaxID=48292 RepID=UPI001A575212|nr:metalloregulator ArsR/SmtB family transcription factor [Hyphomicrobium zavarzinii]MBL8844691.1 helix-turn-helix transcriptional regulator [Hyphomicrobium zavarzinii]
MNIKELTSSSEDAAALLKALANPHRLMILCELHNGERSVSALEEVVPLSQSALSQHLAKLREGGFVVTRREAQMIYYALADERVSRLIGVLHEIFCEHRAPKNRRLSK